MSKEIKGTIEELEAVVRDLHRSAANLDNIIQSIELNEVYHNDTYHLMDVVQEAQYRRDFKQVRKYNQLEERENLIWQKLIENLKTEKES